MTYDQILNAIEAEYAYWRDHDDDENEAVACRAAGAMGACANLLAIGRGLMRRRPERSTEVAVSDDGLKLLPCPFCGGKPVVRIDSQWMPEAEWEYTIECSDCAGSMHFETGVPHEIELMWNRRRLTIIVPETPKAWG